MATPTLRNCIGGEWVSARDPSPLEVHNPATGERLAFVPRSDRDEVDQAVHAAAQAFEPWRRTAPVERARVLFRFKALLDAHHEELARIVTSEHGKTLGESMGSVKRGIENVEHACGIPTLLLGESAEDVARGIDCVSYRQPLGVFVGVVPFNFPAMVPLWFWPYAVATGNTFIVKPSERVPLSSTRVMELALEAGLPPGVLGLVHGDAGTVQALVDHPGTAGLSFVGSTPVARALYLRAAQHGKRVQALGGAKNHILVLPDARPERAAAIATDSVFGCAGQRCLAGSVVVGIGSAYEGLREAVLAAARRIVVGPGWDPNVTMGPVISSAARARIEGTIARGEAAGARILLDGRGASVEGYPGGHWLGPTVAEVEGDDADENPLAAEEVFGPVLVLRRAADLDAAIALVRRCPYANACSIVTESGAAARKFRHEAGVSMLGINVGVAAPMAFFPFGGTKQSFFGDLKAHGHDAIRFFTDAKIEISRWD